MFSPEEWDYALYMPPFSWRILLKWPLFWERLGLVLWPTFSGVIMVEATKQVYAAVPARETQQGPPPHRAGPRRRHPARWGLARQQEHRLLAEQILREERHGDAELRAHRR